MCCTPVRRKLLGVGIWAVRGISVPSSFRLPRCALYLSMVYARVYFHVRLPFHTTHTGIARWQVAGMARTCDWVLRRGMPAYTSRRYATPSLNSDKTFGHLSRSSCRMAGIAMLCHILS